MPAVMSNLPSFCPLVASALLRIGSMVTCRPSAANSPWSGQLVSRGRTVRPWNPDSGHTGTIRITAQLHRTSRNGMKPRIQCALTP